MIFHNFGIYKDVLLVLTGFADVTTKLAYDDL